MDTPRLAEGEYRFACIVWENEPLPSGKLVELSQRELGWKKSTTYTVLKKLIDKGVLQNDGSAVTSLIPREAIQREESQAVVDRTFNGSLPSFLTAFFGGRHISAKEAEELKALIDAHRKEDRHA